MSDIKVPEHLAVPMNSLIALAVEWWRLNSSVASTASGAARHALRKMEDFLRQCELEIQTMDGRKFDPGLPLRVVDTVDDPSLRGADAVIEQTISPIVLWRGRVIRTGEVVTRRGVRV